MKRMLVECSREVASALRRRSGVVALESTIITHGMKWPENLKLARDVESIVRAKGCTPATIAILDGKVRVGLDDAQMERVAMSGRDGTALKCSKRDIAAIAATKRTGATTVAATVAICEAVGIDVFATGGIGGVHHSPWDVSNDLIELGRTPVAVVCSGCKSVLDVEATLEVLETQGVAVFGYGTDTFQTFFQPSSFKAPLRVDEPNQVARWIEANRDLGLRSGAVVAVPHRPSHPDAIQLIEEAVKTATADPRQPKGNEATPWLLKTIDELTGGASVRENVALVRRNVSVASDIANALGNASSANKGQIVCIGASAKDAHVDRDGRLATVPGGVAANIASAARYAGASVDLVSSSADKLICFPDQGLFEEPDENYKKSLVEETRDFFFGMRSGGNSRRRPPRVTILDADIPTEVVDIVVDDGGLEELWFDPTNPEKGARLAPRLLGALSMIAPNRNELDAMLLPDERRLSLDDKVRALASRSPQKNLRVLVTLGDEGCLFRDRDGTHHRILVDSFFAVDKSSVVSEHGAGDTLLGVTAAAWLQFECDESRFVDAIRLGMRGAAMTIQDRANVSPLISTLDFS